MSILSVEDYLKKQLSVEQKFLRQTLEEYGLDPKEISLGRACQLRSELLLSPRLNGSISYCPFRRHRPKKKKNKWY
jgi:hypothetical protein